MPTLFVQPSRTAPGQVLFGIQFPWDQGVTIQGALLGMQNRAQEGVAKGTNRAADRVRENLINDVANRVTLMRSRIESAIVVTAEATEDTPAAQVSVKYQREPLINYEHYQDDTGMFATQFRADGARKIPAAFVATMHSGHEGIFQRQIRGGKRVGRLPIKERMGESVKSIVEQTPGLLDQEMATAQTVLVQEISEVRNEIVDDFQEHPSAFAQAFPKAADFISDVLILPKIFARFIR